MLNHTIYLLFLVIENAAELLNNTGILRHNTNVRFRSFTCFSATERNIRFQSSLFLQIRVGQVSNRFKLIK